VHLGVLDDVADDGAVQAFLAAEIILDGRRFTPARSASWRVLVPSYPSAAKISSAASRMRRRASSPLVGTAGRRRAMV
jgi:hypothetical protein